MLCPRCMKNDVSLISDGHYVCNDPNCKNEDGTRTQFYHVVDDKIHFPYNQIFLGHAIGEFFRKPYLVLNNVGQTNTQR